jgi:hypothetical protein
VVKDVTVLDMIERYPGPAADEGIDQDLSPYIAELLEGAPQVTLDYLTEDLGRYERTGRPSLTISRLLTRARCLAEADRIERKFAA